MIQTYILCILILIFFIALSTCYIEPFEQNHVYICAGDSIINNSNYVAYNKSVAYMLQKKIPCHIVAQDNACISDIYTQFINVPEKYTQYDNISVILSVGGNDLLEGNDINMVYKKYIQMVDDIISNHLKGNGKAYLFNIYYPKDSMFHMYYPIITDWNNRLSQLYNNKITIIDIASIMKNTDDFTHGIEPSERGGAKVVDAVSRSI